MPVLVRVLVRVLVLVREPCRGLVKILGITSRFNPG